MSCKSMNRLYMTLCSKIYATLTLHKKILFIIKKNMLLITEKCIVSAFVKKDISIYQRCKLIRSRASSRDVPRS